VRVTDYDLRSKTVSNVFLPRTITAEITKMPAAENVVSFKGCWWNCH